MELRINRVRINRFWPVLFYVTLAERIHVHLSGHTILSNELNQKSNYRSGTVISNMVNSNFHLIRSYCEIFFYHFPNISCLKCTVNSNFHLIWSKTLLTNDFQLTVPNLYTQGNEEQLHFPSERVKKRNFVKIRLQYLLTDLVKWWIAKMLFRD